MVKTENRSLGHWVCFSELWISFYSSCWLNAAGREIWQQESAVRMREEFGKNIWLIFVLSNINLGLLVLVFLSAFQCFYSECELIFNLLLLDLLTTSNCLNSCLSFTIWLRLPKCFVPITLSNFNWLFYQFQHCSWYVYFRVYFFCETL